jgi:hypothetical protein
MDLQRGSEESMEHWRIEERIPRRAIRLWREVGIYYSEGDVTTALTDTELNPDFCSVIYWSWRERTFLMKIIPARKWLALHDQ